MNAQHVDQILDVWWDERHVGRFTRDEGGQTSFVYSVDWLQRGDAPALSVSLPKRAEPYPHRECLPFFRGLLPEEGQRDAAAQVLDISPEDDLSFLERLGGDVAGAIRFLPPEELPTRQVTDQQARPLDEADLIRVLDALPERPLLAGGKDLRLSLAGTRPKVPVVLENNAIALPAPGQPTTHILKLPATNFPGIIENEVFAMHLAAAVGLDAVPVEAYLVQGRTFILVERYDRSVDADGGVRRLHQENFCQALGVLPERKHASEGDPTLKNCFTLLRHVAFQPAVEVLKLLDAVIFNLIIGNTHAHGKKFSILYTETGPHFAPLYDLLVTVAYQKLSARMAMKIGGRKTLAEMDIKAWREFAADVTLGFPLIRRRAIEISEGVKAKAPEVASALKQPGFDEGALSLFAEKATYQAEQCMATVRD